MKQIFFVSSILTLLTLANLVSAQWYLVPPQSDVSNLILNLLKLPQGSLEASNFLWYVLVPFIAVWAIVLGFLRTLRIFRTQSNLEIIISFTMAFATLPTGIFMSFVNLLLGLSGVWATLIFFVMFIVGVFLYARGWTGSLWQMKGAQANIRRLMDELRKIDDQILKEKKAGHDDIVVKLEQERNAITARLVKERAYLEGMAAERRREYE